MTNHNLFLRNVWADFCERYQVEAESVDLFDAESNVVRTVSVGRYTVLLRSPAMEERLIRQCALVTSDFRSGAREFDGIIYMAMTIEERDVVPIYIGKTEKFGRKPGTLSANLKDTASRTKPRRDKFCRWGYNLKYHIGELSQVVLQTDGTTGVSKYHRWKKAFFDGPEPRLRIPIRFWAKASPSGSVGLWREFGPTSLTFLEYQMIAVGKALFGERLLNAEGVNRE